MGDKMKMLVLKVLAIAAGVIAVTGIGVLLGATAFRPDPVVHVRVDTVTESVSPPVCVEAIATAEQLIAVSGQAYQEIISQYGRNVQSIITGGDGAEANINEFTGQGAALRDSLNSQTAECKAYQ